VSCIAKNIRREVECPESKHPYPWQTLAGYRLKAILQDSRTFLLN
jgi:hypothetical protein